LLIRKVRYGLIRIYYQAPLEAVFWSAGLIALAFYYPMEDQHVSFCLFKYLGFNFCPGCGLGRSISYLLHGDILSSLQSHPLGFIALLILLHRIFQLTRNFIRNHLINKTYYG
jgi:hypothetical protein